MHVPNLSKANTIGTLSKADTIGTLSKADTIGTLSKADTTGTLLSKGMSAFQGLQYISGRRGTAYSGHEANGTLSYCTEADNFAREVDEHMPKLHSRLV